MNKPMCTRLWSETFELLYDSETDCRTVEEFLADRDWVHVTYDFGDGSWRTRQAGRLIKTANGSIEFHSAREYLKHIVSNPISTQEPR